MEIRTPKGIEKVLWSGKLRPSEAEDSVGSCTRVDPEERERAFAKEAIRELPSVSIGLPEVWALDELFSGDALPRHLSDLRRRFDLYFVRFACSFLRRPQLETVEWARFLREVGIKQDHAAGDCIGPTSPKRSQQGARKGTVAD